MRHLLGAFLIIFFTFTESECKLLGRIKTLRPHNRLLGEDNDSIAPFPSDFLSTCDSNPNASFDVASLGGTAGQGFGKFILVGKLKGLLTKSRIHLSEILSVARLTNRILVFPKGKGGEIGCGNKFNNPICTYFDVNMVGNYTNWVSEEYFFERMNHFVRSNQMPSVHGIWIDSKMVSVCSPGHFDLNETESRSQAWKDLDPVAKNLLFRASSMCFHNCPFDTSLQTLTQIVQERLAGSSDILVISKVNQFDCISTEISNGALDYLKYNQRIEKFTDKFVETHGKFISVHWRMQKSMWQKLNLQQVRICAKGLVTFARELAQKGDISSIFLALDLRSNNRSYVSLHKNFTGLSRVVKGLHRAVSLYFTSIQLDHFYPQIENVDNGIRNSIEKIICAKAVYFLYAPDTCRAPSSFAEEIKKLRLEKVQSPETSLPWTLPLGTDFGAFEG